ncbi:MAG: hypothetical protein HYY18_21775 [Planctomycetes bacterium]|nr:hypothetical protein [Planctomycetota bacterium]
MASEDTDYGGVIKFLIFVVFALFGIVSSAIKKRKEQQEIAERQAELRRLDDALGEDRVRKGSSRKWSPPVPVAVAVEAPAEPVVIVAEPEPVRPRKVAKAAPVAAAGVDYRKAVVWREILLPPLALREEMRT